jgi:hypothetical protein
LEPLVAKELETLLALKKVECDDLKKDFDGKINAWYDTHLLYLMNVRHDVYSK